MMILEYPPVHSVVVYAVKRTAVARTWPIFSFIWVKTPYGCQLNYSKYNSSNITLGTDKTFGQVKKNPNRLSCFKKFQHF